jgi:hypothetical protein
MSLISRFFKIIKKADLEDDMAKRIMYSLTLSKSNKSEIEHNLGNANLDMLNAAIEGADDIIEYGSLAVLNELQHSKKPLPINKNEIKNLINGPKTNNYYNELNSFLKEAVELFNIKYLWDLSFGGFAWERIAKSLEILTNLKDNLTKVKDENKLTEIKKKIVLELNYFDSLAHNNGSIYTKLIDLESKKLNKEDFYNLANEYAAITNFVKKKLNIDPYSVSDKFYFLLQDPSYINIEKVLNDLNEFIATEKLDNEVLDALNKLKKILEKNLHKSSDVKTSKINELMDAKDLQDPDHLYSVLHPYIKNNRLQFRDALNNFNRFISPEQEEIKLLEMNKTRLSRMGFDDAIHILDQFIKKNILYKPDHHFTFIIENIKEALGKKVSKEMQFKINLIEEKVNKLANIDKMTLPETNGKTIEMFIEDCANNYLDYNKRKNADETLDKINEIYIKEAKFLKSMLQALIL